MSRPSKSKIFPVLFSIVALSGILWIFYDSFYGSVTGEHENEVNTVLIGSKDAVFEPVLPDDPVAIPEDFKEHPEFQHEWWHFFANVQDENDEHYGIQWSFFRIASDEREIGGWQSPQTYLSHVVITSNQASIKEQRVARGGIGQAGVQDAPFGIWIDNWRWSTTSNAPFPSTLNIETDEFKVNLHSSTIGPYVVNGDLGYQIKHDLLPVASFSVAAPFIRTKGQLVLGGKTYRVQGEAWFNKEWGSGLLAEGQQGWDQFSLRLTDGRTLMVNQYRHVRQPSYTFGTIADRKGDVVILKGEDVEIVPIGTAKLRNGRKLPLQWVINVPKYNINLTTRVMKAEQWLPFAIPYWEGPIVATGSHEAVGLMQLTGY
ncbi:lipocalin-like domain-containing protein [Vibrio penaeicida]|uniref:lipocalin-like domain-containing protein n=1 Tax=Vibrio penaeicida TaxID=104609 RepID=UPI002733E02E|nr:lipocalin-like domain-containing protein [Vibrio penaeicida]MDP2570748.1 lipocalin-like domain-containing protein [Vibrio penaeicida]